MRALFVGDGATFDRLTHPEFTAAISGDMAACTVRDRAEFVRFMGGLRTNHFTAGRFTMAIGAVTAEDDRVLLEAESRIPLQNGDTYNNFYIWSFRVRDGQVVRLNEIIDTLHAHTVFGDPAFQNRIERRNLMFGAPSLVVEGDMHPPHR